MEFNEPKIHFKKEKDCSKVWMTVYALNDKWGKILLEEFKLNITKQKFAQI